MVRAQITGAVAGAVMASLLATACSSSEADPQSAPTPTPSASVPAPSSDAPTTDTTPAPAKPKEPSIPAAARAPGRAGAEALVRYYIDLLNYAGLTGDTRTFSVAARRCSSCSALADNFKKTYGEGGYYESKGWRINTIFSSRTSRHRYITVAEVRETPIEWRVKAGGPIHRLPEEELNLRFSVVRHDSSWRITALTRS